MGNSFRNSITQIYSRPKNNCSDNDPFDPTRIQFPSAMGSEPTISIPIDSSMDQTIEKRIKFRVRHAASDLPATVEAHKDHKISILKQSLIRHHIGIPLSVEDNKCKISVVWNKPNLLPDIPLNIDGENISERHERLLGGSIDHLTLGEYGLENGDFLMFIVTFRQMW